MIRVLAIAAVGLTAALDMSGAAAQSRISGTGVGPDVCNSRLASCATDREGRRWCQMRGQSRVLCEDPRFRMPQRKAGHLRNVVPEAIERCVAAGMVRARSFAGDEARLAQVGAIRGRCELGGYKKFLDPNYVPK